MVKKLDEDEDDELNVVADEIVNLCSPMESVTEEEDDDHSSRSSFYEEPKLQVDNCVDSNDNDDDDDDRDADNDDRDRKLMTTSSAGLWRDATHKSTSGKQTRHSVQRQHLSFAIEKLLN